VSSGALRRTGHGRRSRALVEAPIDPAPLTIFDTPVLGRLLHYLAVAILRLRGWTLVGGARAQRRFVIIAVPHTSNWDLPLTLTVAFALRLKIHWLGKREIFRRPFGPFFRWLGGIAIDRDRSNDTVSQAADLLRRSDDLVLLIPPEGSRRRVRYWKTGFYWVAHGAAVPIALGFLDYGRKRTGIGPLLTPCGDIEADMMTIREFYADMRGKYPDQSTAAEVRATKDDERATGS